MNDDRLIWQLRKVVVAKIDFLFREGPSPLLKNIAFTHQAKSLCPMQTQRFLYKTRATT